MPKIYVLLSKGFVVNDGRLAWFALVALPSLGLGTVGVGLGCSRCCCCCFGCWDPLGPLPMAFQATYVVFFLLVWGFLVFLAMRVINLTCNQI